MVIGSLVPPTSKPWALAFASLSRDYPGHRFVLGEEATAPVLSDIEALVAARVSAATLEGAASLRALFVPLAGINHLPVEILAARGIHVYNVHANAESVAQNALAMILAFRGRLIEYHNDLARTRWHGFWVGKGAEDEWDSIFGTRCAILGTGSIGSALALLLKAFRCEVVGWRRRPEAPLPPGFDRVETRLEAALAGASIVVSTLPLTPETRGLVTEKVIAAMEGALFINVGRGEVVDEEALYRALRDKVIAGAGLDVWYRYPGPGQTSGAPSRFPIHELPNIVLSPHVGGSTRQASRLAIESTAAHLRSWLETGTAPDEVDLAARY